ncbi:MAG: SdrD B-like domain-containing protein, partial [Pseudomonadales bacterium]|nr:SdrD B-like domain-containing protein [Pseudomonadales bacterium]
MGGYAARCRGVCCVGRFGFAALISLLLSNNLLANDTDVSGVDAGVQLQKSVIQVVAPGDDPGSIGPDISFVEKPVLGLAKSAGDSIWLGDHRFRVTIVLLASNSGGQKAKDINIFDDLADTFAASTAFHVVPGSVSSDVFNTNPNFNGRSDTALLTAGNTLSAGAQGSVVFSVEYEAPDTEGVFTNIAKLVSNNAAFDLSTDGSTPDPDGDGRPDEQVPTSITYKVPPPLLGLAKAVSGISQVENNTFIVDFELNVENFGAGPAHEINLQDNLATAFNSALRYQVVSGSLRSASFTVDETFDGMTQQRLLLGGNSLAAGATGIVHFSVEYEVGEATENLANSALVVSQGGLPDDSVSGTDPDPNGDGFPTEKGPTQIPAEFTAPPVPQVGLAKAVLPLARDGPEVAVQVQLVAVNLGDVDLHDVQIVDDLNLTFPADIAFEVVPGSLQSSDLNVNQSFDGDLDTRLLGAGVALPAGSRAAISFELEFIPLLERGTFFNTARVITGGGLEDDSTSGDNPDPDGDGKPDEAEPTAISYVRPEPAAALLGVAKAVAEPVFLDTGRYQVRYLLTIENFGATSARDVRLIDNLDEITSTLSDVAVVPGSLMSSELIVNPDFDGLTNVDLLSADTELAAGQVARVEFLVEFSPPDETTRLANTVVVSARDIPPDDSVPGTDPDPNGDGVPDESGVTEQDIEPRPEPEAEKFAVLGLAKSATTAIYRDELFVSTISFTVENLGNKALTELQVTDSLADVFPEGVGFSVVNGSLNSPTLAINPNFDGVGDQDLLLGSDELAAGAIAQLQFDLAISPGDNPGPFRNTGIATAAEGLRDVSTDGTDPDPDNDDKPDEDQQSLINLDLAPALLLRKIVNTVEQTQQGFTVAFELLVENTGNVPLSELQLTDDLQSFAADVSALQVVAPPSASGAVSQVNSDFSLGDPRLLSGSETLPVGAQVRIMFELAFAAVSTSQALINSAQVDALAPDGRVVQERAEVEVNLPGGIAGIVYLDENHNGELDETEPAESNYLVQLLDPEGRIIATASVDDEGRYRFVELPAGEYELRYRQQDSEVVWGRRDVISVVGLVSVVNLPVSPQGVVYDSNVRAPLAGVQVGLADGAGQLLPASCLLPGQQNQVTDNSGRYVLSIQHGAASSCPTAAQNYQLVITAVPQGYLNGLSRRLPPETGVFDLSQCGSPCLLQPQNEAPAEGLDTRYIENFRSASSDPVLINNHLPIDRPTASGGPTSAGLEISVSASRRSVSPGGVVGYVISITNTSVVPATNTQLTDRLAPAVSRVGDTATLVRPGEDGVFGTGDDLRLEWAVSGDRESVFAPFDIAALSEVRIEFVGRVSANARPGPQENRSAATAAFPTGLESVFDTAVVNVTADVLMDKATLIGKVFLDLNRNGVQDHKDENGELLASPERGLAGVRLITPEGLVVETDQHGRYHIADIAVTRSMGINYVIKIDSLSLPEKARVLNDLRQVARLMPGDIGKVNYAIDIPGAVEECCPKFNPLTSFDPFRPEKKLDIWVASVGARQSNVVPVQFGVSSNYFASLGSGVITLIAKQPLGETSIDSACFEFTSDRRRISLQKKLDLRINPGRYEYRLKVFAENVCSEPESTWQTFASDKTAAQMLDLNVVKSIDMGVPIAGRNLLESSGIVLSAVNRRLSHHKGQLLVEALVTDSVSFLESHAVDWRAVETEDKPANPIRPIYENSTLEVNYNWRGVDDSPASTRKPSVTLERGVAPDIDEVKYSAQGTKVEMTCCGVLTYASTFIDDNNSVTTLRLSNRSDATDLDVCVMKKSERALPDIPGSCLFEQVLRAGTTNELFLGVFDNGPESTAYWEELRVQLQDPAGRKFYYDVRRTRASEDGVLRPPRITAECFDLRATPQTTEERGVASINLTREAAAVPLSEQNYGVGVLDLTFGHNQRSGDLDSAFIDEQFDRGSYGDGRIAAYWRGVKPMGERDLSWVFQVDSTKDELSNFTDNLQRENPDRIFRQLDGDLYYPTYGDDSTTLLDTNSQGAFYARLNYASSHALWGNYNSQLNTSEFSHYNRSLYGFQTHIESEKQNSSGAALHALKLFASQAQSTSAHAEFGATGGSLYYLRHTDIV